MSRSVSIPLTWGLAALFLAHAACALGAASAHDCTRLAHLTLADTRILGAETVDGPAYQPAGAEAPLANLPSFCRVSAVIAPAIHFELWLPLADWNGKFQGTGNGGYSGAIVYNALAEGVRRHYATSSTDMGHVSTTPDPGSWALKAPQLVIDQGYRAQHETAVKSKEIIRAFYGEKPRLSYFTGCSSGGWQGLTEAQRYPHEYDGIVAGAPAFEVIHLHAGTLYVHQAASRIPPPKLRLITDAVLAKCDATDGVKDRLLANPLACNFSPGELACRPGDKPESCLNADEVDALQRIYDGARYRSGEQIYPGWPRGVEYALTATQQPFVAALASSTFRDMVFEDPGWDFHQMDLDRDVRQADAKLGAVLNNYSPDLRAFRQAGGKLILWHGWDDPLISPLHTLEYYRNLARYLAPKSGEEAGIANVQSFARLFLAPGVNHCRGGPGPDSFDALTALEQWVEKGVAPDRMVASHKTGGAVDRTRPLCPYPKVAVWSGQGSTDEAESFTCRAP